MYFILIIPDLLGEGGLLTDDVLLSALGDDVNFDLIDDIQQQPPNAESIWHEHVSTDAQINQEHIFGATTEVSECHTKQRHVDPSMALTSTSSDPKLFNALLPEEPTAVLSNVDSVRKEQDASVNPSLPFQLSPQQIAILQQQRLLQVRI